MVKTLTQSSPRRNSSPSKEDKLVINALRAALNINSIMRFHTHTVLWARTTALAPTPSPTMFVARYTDGDLQKVNYLALNSFMQT